MSQYQKLAVYEKEGSLFQADASQSTIDNDGLKLTAENIHDTHIQKILRDKIGTALKLVKIREQKVLIQFWSSHVVGKDQALTNIGQPYGLGANDDKGLLSYRKKSQRMILVADNHLYPPGRVFNKRFPEWTSDLSNYLPNDFPQQEFAKIDCNLHGYLALPVFDRTTKGLCVGVLELLGSSEYTSFAYEVNQVHDALKEQNLTCPPSFDHPALNVPNEREQNERENIDNILKRVCEIHKLPFAQTWKAVSPSISFVSHDSIIVKTCSSFDTNCIGKICMSTVDQPLFYIGPPVIWDFVTDCEKIHLEKSKGVVGRALESKDLWYCGDVTKLSDEEYPPPLAILARTCEFTGCFAIFLHGVESNDDYVLEFFLRLGMEDDDRLTIKDVVQTLKEKVKASPELELGDTSSIQEVGLPSDSSDISN